MRLLTWTGSSVPLLLAYVIIDGRYIYLPFSGVFCGFPGNIRNGWIDGQRFTFDNRIRYSCKKGFERVGPATRYCGEDGRWEGEEPSCEGKWGPHTRWLYHHMFIK